MPSTKDRHLTNFKHILLRVKGAPPACDDEPESSSLLVQLLAWSAFLLVLILLAWLVVRLPII